MFILHRLGYLFGHFLVDFGPFWTPFGTILEPKGRPGTTLGSDPRCPPSFGPSWGTFWSHLAPLGLPLGHLGVTLVPFWVPGRAKMHPKWGKSDPKRTSKREQTQETVILGNRSHSHARASFWRVQGGPKAIKMAPKSTKFTKKASKGHQNMKKTPKSDRESAYRAPRVPKRAN